MEIAKVSVSGVAATAVEATTIPAGIIGATIAVEYGPEWGGMIKNVSFRGAEDVTVVNVGNVVKLPQEVAAKPNMYIQIGFTGVSGDGTVLIPTLWAYLGTTKPASPVNVEGGSTPPVWAQVVAMIGDLNQLNTPSQDNLVNAINDAAKSGNGNVDLSGFVKSVNGVKPDADGNVEVKVSSDSGQTAALTTAQIDALHGMFKVCAYDDSKDVSGAYAAFKTAFGITDTEGDSGEDSGGSGEDSGGDSGETEVTLTSISAVYSGGDVAVGTAVTALTGIVVTAHYSDGTSAPVTGYTLSGTIAEGENTVTVSYGGKATTFTVTGVAESGGETEGVAVAMTEQLIDTSVTMTWYSDGGDTLSSDCPGRDYLGILVSDDVFAEDTTVKITLTASSRVFNCYNVGCFDYASDETFDIGDKVYYATHVGDNTWANSGVTHELEYTVRAGYHLIFTAYGSFGTATTVSVEVV